MKEERFFTILIALYNCEKYISKCLESVLNQTYKNFRIVIVNDGSTDESGKICDVYAKKYEFIKVIHHIKNKGIVQTRRDALKHATDEFFLFLDSDDYWDYNLLETINHTINKSKADIVFFRYKQVSESGIYLSEQSTIFENETIIDHNHSNLIFDFMVKSSEFNNLVCKAIKT